MIPTFVPATDTQVIQAEIAQTVSEKLRLKLSGDQETKLAKRETENIQAYELMLKGSFYLGKGDKSSLEKAVGYLNQAIALDPNYAQAYIGLSTAYRYVGANSYIDPKEATPKAGKRQH